ncbi:hypothetical protein EG329_005487 [Mollisiaceae sp. DMI_Dod_QoI]|nr:hypothetical protein EG329_005487 [Helotiales sp. DMI_Dod_QoI]
MPFTSFLKLPLELRQKIWVSALPGRRVITIFYTTDSYAPPEPITQTSHTSPLHSNGLVAHAWDTDELHSLYFTCTESRNMLQEYYAGYFRDRFEGRPVWFEVSIGSLYLPAYYSMYFLQVSETPSTASDLCTVRKLALQAPVSSARNGECIFSPSIAESHYLVLSFLVAVREVTFVSRYEEEFSDKFVTQFLEIFRANYRVVGEELLENDYDEKLLDKLDFKMVRQSNFLALST